MIYVRPDLEPLFANSSSVLQFQHTDCRVVRQVKNRFTGAFERGGRGFYIKYHKPIGVRPIVKGLVTGRWPTLGAATEVEAIRRIEQLGVATTPIAAWGRQGKLPTHQHSFLITEQITEAINLETLTRRWAERPPPPRFRRRLVRAVARIARTLHEAGLNHRDFYLCHFLLDTSPGLEIVEQRPEPPTLYLLDLHRVQQRRHTPRRWRIKDVGGLDFSALDAGLTQRDRLRFIKDYTGLPLPTALNRDHRFWQSVRRRARSMYLRHWNREPLDHQ